MGVDSADGGGEMGNGEGSNSFGNEYWGGGMYNTVTRWG